MFSLHINHVVCGPHRGARTISPVVKEIHVMGTASWGWGVGVRVAYPIFQLAIPGRSEPPPLHC